MFKSIIVAALVGAVVASVGFVSLQAGTSLTGAADGRSLWASISNDVSPQRTAKQPRYPQKRVAPQEVVPRAEAPSMPDVVEMVELQEFDHMAVAALPAAGEDPERCRESLRYRPITDDMGIGYVNGEATFVSFSSPNSPTLCTVFARPHGCTKMITFDVKTDEEPGSRKYEAKRTQCDLLARAVPEGYNLQLRLNGFQSYDEEPEFDFRGSLAKVAVVR
jgi:hypothetical protein